MLGRLIKMTDKDFYKDLIIYSEADRFYVIEIELNIEVLACILALA